MDCKLFDEIADHISKSGYEEIECRRRTSSGRHYYFIYHTVKDWLTKNHPEVIKNMGGSSHEKLQFCMEQLCIDCADKKFGMLALKLKTLHRIRVHADYYLDDEFLEGQITMIKKEKERVCELLRELETKS
ncbi:hypothetical protein [Acinetobacter sp. YH12145]|uniref:hypothetical protein n=1 Tax=Acinetobacter sp. YH12145 TaxID=2601129 RepID=UPI0015D249F9|nr:hypothetical protein [Acinetobacter sp. YH12145]